MSYAKHLMNSLGKEGLISMHGLAKIAYRTFNPKKRVKPLTEPKLRKELKGSRNKYDNIDQEIAHRTDRSESASKRLDQIGHAWANQANKLQMGGGSRARKLHSDEVQNDWMRLTNAKNFAENRAKMQNARLNQLQNQ
jgi:hypothetical protein